jgi:hypothetical protein
MKLSVKMLLALALLASMWPVAADARHRGETCWRTNRHTHQHFRIC